MQTKTQKPLRIRILNEQIFAFKKLKKKELTRRERTKKSKMSLI